ncbi:EAL domain-containing protein [Thiocystis violacea]|uniref:bifunctional diguanylate cyclase/phosphodiesterase n=1 Tax=Thiocystis violacea TaxID=13725 RepID=UPI00190792C8|nr:EAL domain-containing protein [Thiocystis violacea]MBK1720290.1 hypothetical protein [Thiocystis violacea]
MKPPNDPASNQAVREKARRILRERTFENIIGEIQRGDIGLAELLEELHLYHAALQFQQEALRDSQAMNELALARFARLYRDLPLPALLISWQGVLKEHNRAAGETLAMDCKLFTHLANPLQSRVLEQALETARSRGRAECREVALRSVRYDTLIVDLVLILLPGGEREESEFVCTLVDQTDRIAQRDALRSTAEVVDASTTVAVRWQAKPGLPLVYASENVRRWGYPPQTFLAGYMHLVDLVHPDDRTDLEASFAREIANRHNHFTLTFRIRWADGSVHWVELDTSIQARADGADACYQGLITDVTEREQAQAALRQQLRFQELAAEISSLFVNSQREDLDRMLDRALARIGQFLGVDRAYLHQYRTNDQELAPTHDWHADSRPAGHDGWPLATTSDLAALWERLDADGLLQIPDVLVSPRENRFTPTEPGRPAFRARLLLPLSSEGQRLGVFGFDTRLKARHWDTEEIRLLRVLGEAMASVLVRQRAERELQASERRYRRVASIMSDVAYCCLESTEGDYEIDWITDSIEVLTGHRLQDVLAQRGWRFLVIPEDQETLSAQVMALTPGKTSTCELRIRHKDGSLRWIRSTTECLLDAANSGRKCLYGGLVDITEQKARGAELQRLALVVEQSPSIVLVSDPTGRIEYVNQRFREVTGYDIEEVRGQSVEILKTEATPMHTWRDVRRTLMRGQAWRGEFQHRKKSGEIYWEQALITPLRNTQGDISHFVELGEDVSDKKALSERLTHLIHYDPLTGLPNRALMRERIDRALASARRGGHGLALLSIDIDKLKFINDSLGHAAGDQLLREVARRLQTLLAKEDTLARFGGDNFVLLVGHLDQVQDSVELAERIRALLDQPVVLGKDTARITACAGIALYPEDAQVGEELISHADAALHKAQADGRRLYRFYTPALNKQLLEQFQLEQALRHGLDHDQLRLHYQPRVDIRTGAILSLEALIRWEHPQWGLVEPDRFIPLAEATGLILELGPIVLREACRQIQEWSAAGVPLVPIAVNLSARELYQDELSERIREILEKAGVVPSQLEFEITESATLHSIDQAIVILSTLRDQGFALSIDDFGTGYASLSYLNRLPMQTIKIDRSFLEKVDSRLDGEPQGAAIIKAIIGLGSNLGLHIIAEGVETAHQRGFLIEHGCHVAQGFLFCHPLPASQIEPLLRSGQVATTLH